MCIRGSTHSDSPCHCKVTEARRMRSLSEVLKKKEHQRKKGLGAPAAKCSMGGGLGRAGS